MFGKKAKEIANLQDLVKADQDLIDALTKANTDCQQKLQNAQALIQRAEADRDAQKKRADENYRALELLKAQQADATCVRGPLGAKAPDVQAETPKSKKPKKGGAQA